MGLRGVWVSYPLKQGLKLHTPAGWRSSGCVWVSYPLKQGLKHGVSTLSASVLKCLSQLSIKTRIETSLHPAGCWERPSLSQLSIKTRIETHKRVYPRFHQASLSQLSIKTRIETNLCRHQHPLWRHVWVSYPLKQGLKLMGRIKKEKCPSWFESAIH